MSVAMHDLQDRPVSRATALDEAACWKALESRDPRADGSFVFSVRSTGIYCRPSCAARRPKPENVAFHRTCEEAERAGFRPCKRCRPNEASQRERDAAAIARACRLIAEAETPLTLTALAEAAGMSQFHFHRTFRRITGVTPKAYADARRAERVASSLRETGATITEAVYEAGYGSSSRFYKSSGERLGMTPTAYRQGGAGAEISFAIGACSLGSVLVAATDRGVAAIMLGDDPDALRRDLRERFPKARINSGDPAFETTVARVIRFIEAPGNGLDLPLDIAGTAFQQRVWQALRAIPPGETASYADIARAIGEPRSIRAVARACASNKLAVAIPCHRVVRTDGGLSGYRWGVERKRALLARERENESR